MQFEVRPHQIDEERPLIYMWEIYGESGQLIGRYVGRSKDGAKRPLKHYARNVANILASKHYRKGNPDGFRKIHRALADAQRLGHLVVLSFLCNVSQNEDINEVERRCISDQHSQGDRPWQLNG